MSGFSIIGLVTNQLGAESGSNSEPSIGDGPRSTGRSRSVDYDMNLSRSGKHQDITISGRRAMYGYEFSPPIESMAIGDVNNDTYDDLIIGAPGDNISIEGSLITPIAMEKELRFAIREGGRTVGAGVISEIIE